MALTVAQRKAAWKEFNRLIEATGPVRWNKTGLDAAATAIDTWCTNNQSSLVTAINSGAPAFGGANSTAAEKEALFTAVVRARAGQLG